MKATDRTGSVTTAASILALSLVMAAPAHGATDLPDPGASCIEEVAGQALNCTANDVSIALAIAESPVIEGCDDGGPNDTATFKLLADLQSGANERYDIGIYVALDGGNARTGVCSVSNVDIPPGSDLEQKDDPTDTCGDIEADTFIDNALVGDTITVPCIDLDGDTFLDINTCVSWDNNDDGHCEDPTDAFPSTKSKCRCERINITNITVPPNLCETDDECNNGLFCDGVETCAVVGTRKECVLGTPVVCTDGIECTTDVCDEVGDACDYTGDDTVCADDSLECTDAQCDPTQGCVQANDDTNSCSDDVSCTNDACSAGSCVATPDDSQCPGDGLECTDAACDPQAGCVQVNDDTNTCSDDVSCTNDACSAGSCVATPDDSQCPGDGLECTDAACDPQAGCVQVNDDTNTCTDSVSCTNDLCSAGACVSAPDDSQCPADALECTDAKCNPAVGCQQVNDDTNTCTDGVSCTNDTCSAGACVGTPDDAQCPADSLECTDAKCDPAAGCQQVNDDTNTCTDGVSCTNDTCSAGACGSTPDDSQCPADALECTDAKCDPGAGCQQVNDDTNACSDGAACTGDACNAGNCVGTPDNTLCGDAFCTDETCNPDDEEANADGCVIVFDETNGETCELETCRTAGFWSTHGGITQEVLTFAGGCVEVCGEILEDINVSDVNDADSALEAMCVSIEGSSRLQLVRQLTAAALNCVISRGTDDCTNASIEDTYKACTSTCIANNDAAAIGSCIIEIDCFNNGGVFENGACVLGACGGIVGGQPCNETTNCGLDLAGLPLTCMPTPGNCHDNPEPNPELGPDIVLGGGADTSKTCNSANKNSCYVIPGTTGKKGEKGEAKCSSGTIDLVGPESCSQ